MGTNAVKKRKDSERLSDLKATKTSWLKVNNVATDKRTTATEQTASRQLTASRQ